MADGRLSHAVFAREFDLADASGRIAFTDGANVVLGEFHTGIAPAPAVIGTLPPFGSHVGEIISARPEEMMAEVAARPVVAGMANAQPVWDGSVRLLPDSPMHLDLASAVPAEADIAVAVGGPAGPRPTLIGASDLYLRPQAIMEGFALIDTAAEVDAAAGAKPTAALLTREAKVRRATMGADMGGVRLPGHSKHLLRMTRPRAGSTAAGAISCLEFTTMAFVEGPPPPP
jgi:hypothetical protein